jgi:hypothetical protein
MQLPWDREVKPTRGYAIAGDKYFVKVIDPASLSNDLAQSIAKKVSMDPEAFPSKFAWATAVLSVNPNQMKWWQSPSSKRKMMTQVVEKLLFLEPFTDTDKLYSLHFGEMRGFQQGDPPYKVTLNLYDAEDHHYKIFIDQQKNTSPPITQAQINALVASMHSASR